VVKGFIIFLIEFEDQNDNILCFFQLI